MRYILILLFITACTPVIVPDEPTSEPDVFHIKYQNTDLTGSYGNSTTDVYYDGVSNLRIRTFGREATEDFIIDGNKAHCQIRQYATMCALLAENVSHDEVEQMLKSYVVEVDNLQYLGDETHAGLPTKCYTRGKDKVCVYNYKLIYSKNDLEEVEAITYEESIPADIMVAPR